MFLLPQIFTGNFPLSLLLPLLLFSGQIDSRATSRVGVAETGQDEDGTSYARAALADWHTPNGNGALLHTYAEHTGVLGTKTGVGFLKLDRAGVDGFSLSHNVASAGWETGRYGGGMLRATGYDGTLHAGPVDVNAGFSFDHGILVDRNVEVKLLGIGGKIGADGIQACFIVCVGINWG